MRLRTRRQDAPSAAPSGTGGPPVASGATDVERLAESIGTLPIGIVVEDAERRTVVSNGLIRSPVGDVQGDVLAATALARVVAAAHRGEQAAETLELRGASQRMLELRAMPLTAGGVVATIVDVSERRRLDAIRRDFVANVNHELRTPIGALGLLAEALAEQTDPEVVSRLASRIGVEADRATRLLSDLLDFSRVEERAPSTPETVSLIEVVSSAADRVATLADRHAVTVKIEVADASAVVDGDRQQLVSAVTNLLDNAVKYSDDGSTVEVAVSSDSGRGVVVVRDEGIGIPAKDLDRVFERFYRVDRARDRRTGGSGLGLAIVRHVATNHGGEVTVRSQEGVGSTFSLCLPLAGGAA